MMLTRSRELVCYIIVYNNCSVSVTFFLNVDIVTIGYHKGLHKLVCKNHYVNVYMYRH